MAPTAGRGGRRRPRPCGARSGGGGGLAHMRGCAPRGSQARARTRPGATRRCASDGIKSWQAQLQPPPGHGPVCLRDRGPPGRASALARSCGFARRIVPAANGRPAGFAAAPLLCCCGSSPDISASQIFNAGPQCMRAVAGREGIAAYNGGAGPSRCWSDGVVCSTSSCRGLRAQEQGFRHRG